MGTSYCSYRSIGIVLLVGVVGFFLDKHYYHKWVSGRNCKLDISERVERWKNLERNFSREVFGQHIAADTVLRAIYAHISTETPKKALVLSFHGSVGSGKTFMSQLIAKHLYEGGFDSSFVTTFVGPLHFLHDPSKLAENQELLKAKIKRAAKSCNKGLFIFDEVDTTPPEIFNILVPFINYYDAIDGVDYRGLIFIFLSNSGSSFINDIVYDLRAVGISRESIAIKHFYNELPEGVFYSKGGLLQSQMISNRLIDYYIPFLPLEREHVLMCIRRDIVKRRVYFIEPENVATQIAYVRKGKAMFAQDGCKRTLSVVQFYEADSMLDLKK